MRRFVALLVHALGSTERRLGRSVSLGLALALTTAAWSSVFFLSESVRATGDALLEDAPLLTVQRLVAGRPALLDHDDAEALRALRSVRAVHERVWGYLYQPALEGNVVVVGVEPEASATLAEELGFTDGTPLGDEEILVGSTLAATLGLRAGDRLALVGPTGDGPGETAGVQVLRVRAVLPAETAVSHGDTVLASMRVARALLGLEEGACVDLAIDVFPPEEANIVAARAIEAIPGARTLLRDALTRRRALTFEARAGLLSAVLLPLLLSFLVLTWDRLSGMGEDERREIGILKAVGWSTSDVLVCRLLESALIAGLGAALGLVLGYVHVFVLGAPGLSEAYFGWSNLRPAMALVPTLDPQVLVLAFTLVVLPFVAVSIVPAWRAATLDPDRAMRGPRVSDPAPNEEAHADEDREARVILVDVHKRVPDGRQRRVILEGVSLRLHAGELVVAQGPSGSGKSTLLSIVGAMSLPTSGSVIVLGEPVSELRDAHRAALRQRAVGFVFQELGLIGAMTLEENLLLPLVPTGGPTAEEAERIDRLLSRFGLSSEGTIGRAPRRGRAAAPRSGTRAGAEPSLLVLDEPTAHLDADNTSALMKHLEDEKAAGRTVLVSTHDPRVSEHPAVDRVLRLEAGRLLA